MYVLYAWQQLPAVHQPPVFDDDDFTSPHEWGLVQSWSGVAKELAHEMFSIPSRQWMPKALLVEQQFMYSHGRVL